MLRYISLYFSFVRFSLGKAMEFRLDFFFRIFMDLAYYAVNIAFFKVIYLHTELLGGWSEAQMMVFVGCFLVVDALNMTVFANNLWWFPILINRGDLDYYLIRPVSSLFMLSLRDFAGNSLVNLVMAAAILAWAIAGLPEPVSFLHIVTLLLLLIEGCFLYYMVHLLTLIPAFWMQSTRGPDQLFFNMIQFMERPHTIFSGWIRKILLTVLPFGVMASLPAEYLLGEHSVYLIVHISLVCLAFFLLLLFFWKYALASYSSASS